VRTTPADRVSACRAVAGSTPDSSATRATRRSPSAPASAAAHWDSGAPVAWTSSRRWRAWSLALTGVTCTIRLE
jgi:hypothetical protein